MDTVDTFLASVLALFTFMWVIISVWQMPFFMALFLLMDMTIAIIIWIELRRRNEQEW